MSIRGVGIDVASISRFRRLLDRYGVAFEGRWFDELELVQPGSRHVGLARSYAVKEAVWKALELESRAGLPWREIVAVADARGAVAVHLTGTISTAARAANVGRVNATASVMGDVVVAVALIENAPGS